MFKLVTWLITFKVKALHLLRANKNAYNLLSVRELSSAQIRHKRLARSIDIFLVTTQKPF